MNKIKLIALDMDGTLLNSDLIISQKNKESINYTKENGIRIVLCTGRPLSGVLRYAEELNLNSNDAVVVLNGSIIYTGDFNSIIFQSNINNHSLKKMFNYAKAHHYHMHFFNNNYMYTTDLNPGKETLFESELTSCPLIKLPGADFSSFQNVAKVSFFAHEKIFDVDEMLIKKAFSNFNVIRSKPSYIEIMSASASKGHALSRLADYYCIKNEAILGFGDEDNDIAMLEASGISVAMKNATKKMKSIADFITDDNDHDGVAKAISHFISYYTKKNH